MRLTKKFLLKHFDPVQEDNSSLEPKISSIVSHSKNAKKGALFVAVQGLSQDGHDFIEEAVRRRASAILVQENIFKKKLLSGKTRVSLRPPDLPEISAAAKADLKKPLLHKLPEKPDAAAEAFSPAPPLKAETTDILKGFQGLVLQTPDSRKALNFLLNEFYDFPAEKLFSAAFTGSNGKTTSAFLTHHLFENCGWRTGLVSSVERRCGKKSRPALLTTPEPAALFQTLYDFVRRGAKALSIEASSIGLHQGRLQGIDFHVAVFTNLSRDHLDYHKTAENYFQAKKLLFRLSSSAVRQVFLVNQDDLYGQKLIRELKEKGLSAKGAKGGLFSGGGRRFGRRPLRRSGGTWSGGTGSAGLRSEGDFSKSDPLCSGDVKSGTPDGAAAAMNPLRPGEVKRLFTFGAFPSPAFKSAGKRTQDAAAFSKTASEKVFKRTASLSPEQRFGPLQSPPPLRAAVSTAAQPPIPDFSFQIQKESLSGVHFMFRSAAEEEKMFLPLFGAHNVENAAAALAVGVIAGFSLPHLKAALRSFPGVSGRLQKVSPPESPFSVFVDYAHTPSGLQAVLKALKPFKAERRLIVIFGCGGGRDRGKRPLMAKAALRFADQAVLTADNPRFEPSGQIIKDCLKGIKAPFHRLIVEWDRAKAIEKTLRAARAGDIIVIAGKGHETYQLVQGKKFPFSDQKEVLKFFEKAGIKN